MYLDDEKRDLLLKGKSWLASGPTFPSGPFVNILLVCNVIRFYGLNVVPVPSI